MNRNAYFKQLSKCTNPCAKSLSDQTRLVSRVQKTPFCTGLAALLLALPSLVSAQPQAGIIEHPPLPNILSHPIGITAGPDGALWFAEFSTRKIGRVTTAGVLTEYPVPSGSPEVITPGADNALWFTEFDSTKIGRITAAGVITEFPVAHADSHAAITKGPDGALWYTMSLANKIARINLLGAVSEFTIPTAECGPLGIAAGSDGALWFTEFSSNQIGRITTAGVFKEYVVPTPVSGPSGIAAGPDGALWFTESAGNKIGRITTAGVITEFPVPTAFSHPSGIAEGPDAALWFTEFDGNKIGRITLSGVITEFPIPTVPSISPVLHSPYTITAGPDNALWFTEYDGNRIGQAVIPNAVLTANPEDGVPGAKLTLSGSGFGSNETVNFYLNSTGMNLFGTAVADGTGSFQFGSQVFAAPLAYNAVVGVGQTSGALGFTPFTVQARLVVSPKRVSAGDTVTASGYGWASGERVEVYWNKPLVFLGEQTAGSLGTFAQDSSLSFAVPANAAPGLNFIRGVGQTSGAVVYNYVIVQ